MTTRELFINDIINCGYQLHFYQDDMMMFTLNKTEVALVKDTFVLFSGYGKDLSIKFDEMGIETQGKYSGSNDQIWKVGKGLTYWGYEYTRKQG